VQQARCEWIHAQATLDPARLVFLDETWATTAMTRRYGRSPRGTRCVASVPHGHWKTTTFIAGLRHDAITAPMVVDGPMDGATFVAYVREFLCPTLRSGDVVIADNLSSHKVNGVREAIEAVGAHMCYLPAYSPDLNPIEKAFSKLKALLRKAAIRSVEALWTTIGDLLDQFSAQECRNYFSSCGYVGK
jgi:transposase